MKEELVTLFAQRHLPPDATIDAMSIHPITGNVVSAMSASLCTFGSVRHRVTFCRTTYLGCTVGSVRHRVTFCRTTYLGCTVVSVRHRVTFCRTTYLGCTVVSVRHRVTFRGKTYLACIVVSLHHRVTCCGEKNKNIFGLCCCVRTS